MQLLFPLSVSLIFTCRVHLEPGVPALLCVKR